MKKLWFGLLVGVFFITNSAGAQLNPDPIDLKIANIEQEADEWCWVALAQQILSRHVLGQPPSQCQMVGMANEGSEAEAVDCCRATDNALCRRPGNINDVSAIITRYGGRAEAVPVPASPEDIYSYLFSGRALIAAFRITEEKHHAFLVRGLSWEKGQAMLLINDPAYKDSVKVPFNEVKSTWTDVIAVE